MIMQVPQIEEDKPQEGEKIDAMTTSMEGIEDIPNEEKPAEAPPAEAAAAGSSHCYLRLFEDFFAEASVETPKAEESPAEAKVEVAVEEEEIAVEEVEPAGRQTIYLNTLS